MRLALLSAAVLLAGCQTNPKQTVLDLDTTDRRWSSRACVHARKAVAVYDDGQRARGVVGLANFVTPYAGTVASSLMSWRKDPERARLNAVVQQACVTPGRAYTQVTGAYQRKPYLGPAKPAPRRVRRF